MAHTQKLITKFNLDRKNKRFKPHNGSLCVFRPRPQPRNRIVLNALSGVEKNKAATNPITCGLCTSRYFRIRCRSKMVSSLLPNNKSIWRRNVWACSFSIVNPNTIGCVWTCEFDLNALLHEIFATR